MSIFPKVDLESADRFAGRVQEHDERSDQQLLGELWCALRNAESAHMPGTMRVCLNRLRVEVSIAIAEMESEAMIEGPTCGKSPLRSARLRSTRLSSRRRVELERARLNKGRD